MLGIARTASIDVISCAAYLNGFSPTPPHQLLLDELKRLLDELTAELDLLRSKSTLKEDRR